MKEVGKKWYAGPFDQVPFKHYIQSPVGLVPKDVNDTRLIFHLSYPRNGSLVNSETPKHMTTVKYCDFMDAVQLCLQIGKCCWISKSDMSSALRNLGIKKKHWKFLILMARSPLDGKIYYFVDKCLPFGTAISCAHFQRFSNAVAHIHHTRTAFKPPNYLDDFLFAALVAQACNALVQEFLDICKIINFPVSLEKTFWASTSLTFLGMLLDTVSQTVSVPAEKIDKAKTLIYEILNQKKTTVRKLQKLTGFLNFLCRCVVPGRAFLRRIYGFYSPLMLPHHHVRVKQEMKDDLSVWLSFLEDPAVYCRPFIDFTQILTATQLDWFTDASGKIGYGGIFGNHWLQGRWNQDFLKCKPSIEFLELYAVTVSIFIWGEHVRNSRICMHCDNQAMVQMLNNSTSSCFNCLALVRKLTQKCLQLNFRVFAVYVETDKNYFADALSRFQMDRFRHLEAIHDYNFDRLPYQTPQELMPILNNLWFEKNER